MHMGKYKINLKMLPYASIPLCSEKVKRCRDMVATMLLS